MLLTPYIAVCDNNFLIALKRLKNFYKGAFFFEMIIDRLQNIKNKSCCIFSCLVYFNFICSI